MVRPTLVELDLRGVASATDLHTLLKERLSLPDYYGRNWDAFWDVITDEWPLPQQLVLCGWCKFQHRFPREAALMMRCLEDYHQERPDAPCAVRLV